MNDKIKDFLVKVEELCVEYNCEIYPICDDTFVICDGNGTTLSMVSIGKCEYCENNNNELLN